MFAAICSPLLPNLHSTNAAAAKQCSRDLLESFDHLPLLALAAPDQDARQIGTEPESPVGASVHIICLPLAEQCLGLLINFLTQLLMPDNLFKTAATHLQ